MNHAYDKHHDEGLPGVAGSVYDAWVISWGLTEMQLFVGSSR
jgi:hypothetical protein